MTSTTELSDWTTMVFDASRGLGGGIATAFAKAGAPVIAVARSAAELADADGIQPEVADAAHARVAASFLDRYEPGAGDPGSGRNAPDPSATAPDLGGVLGQLVHGRAERVPLVTRGPAQTAATPPAGADVTHSSTTSAALTNRLASLSSSGTAQISSL